MNENFVSEFRFKTVLTRAPEGVSTIFSIFWYFKKSKYKNFDKSYRIWEKVRSFCSSSKYVSVALVEQYTKVDGEWISDITDCTSSLAKINWQHGDRVQFRYIVLHFCGVMCCFVSYFFRETFRLSKNSFFFN